MQIEDYFRQISKAIGNSPIILSESVTYDKRNSYIGFIRGSIWFSDRSVLHFREYINVQNDVDMYMYAYQYQDDKDALKFRYDNTPHFPDLPTFPHHKHDGKESEVIPAIQPNLTEILHEIQQILISE